MLASLSTFVGCVNKISGKFNPSVNLSWKVGIGADASVSSGNMSTDGTNLFFPTSLGTGIRCVNISTAVLTTFANSTLSTAFSCLVVGSTLYVDDNIAQKILQFGVASTPPVAGSSWFAPTSPPLNYPELLCADSSFLYITNVGTGTVQRLQMISSPHIDTAWNPTPFSYGLNSTIYSNGYVYVSQSTTKTIFKISTSTAAVSTLITLASAPKSLAIYGGFMYISVGTNIYLLNMSTLELRTDYVSGLSTTSGCCCIANGDLYVMNTGSIAKIQCQ